MRILEMSWYIKSAKVNRVYTGNKTHINTQIRMHQNLELKVLSTLILHLQRRPQSLFVQRNAVHKVEFIRPRLAELLAQHRMRQAKVKLNGVIPFFPVRFQ